MDMLIKNKNNIHRINPTRIKQSDLTKLLHHQRILYMNSVDKELHYISKIVFEIIWMIYCNIHQTKLIETYDYSVGIREIIDKLCNELHWGIHVIKKEIADKYIITQPQNDIIKIRHKDKNEQMLYKISRQNY